jgi:prevent-host-death family protein
MGRVEVRFMATVPEIIPISDLRQDAAAVVKRARSQRRPIVITQRGRAAAVMVGVEEYERAQHEREILLLLARGEQEIAAGVGSDLDAVLAEADGLLGNAGQ